MNFHDGKLMKNLSLRVTESAAFLKRFVSRPRQVGSVIPSSPFLTKAMMSKINWDEARCIAELGAGTGVFTRAIVRNLRPDGKLFPFEIDPAFKTMIENEHPNLTVYGDATELSRVIAENGVGQLDYVVSSLPFSVLPLRVTVAVFDAVDKCLKPGGKFIAYQYSRSTRYYLEKRFEKINTSFVLCNIPPAFVFECTKSTKAGKEWRKERRKVKK